jgi:hypothetical protein
LMSRMDSTWRKATIYFLVYHCGVRALYTHRPWSSS